MKDLLAVFHPAASFSEYNLNSLDIWEVRYDA
jgi:hypothetical protein